MEITQAKPEMKRCPTCETERKCKFFSKNRARDDGLQRQCKFCDAIYYLKRKTERAGKGGA